MGSTWSDAADPSQLLIEVDKLVVTAIVDNEFDALSSPCQCCDPASSNSKYTSEFNAWTMAVLDGKMDYMDFTKAVMAGHGLSLLITTEVDGKQRSLLLDGGPRQDLWSSNAAELKVDITSVEAAVLTHWHPDHSVGLASVAALSSAQRAGGSTPDLVFDVPTGRPYRRGFRTPTGKDVMFNPDVELSVLQQPGNVVQEHQEPHLLLGGTAFVSGPIPRVTSLETGIPGHTTQRTPDTPPDLDPLIMDERCLAVKVKGLGVVVFTGCSHAGVVNVVKHINSLIGADSKVVGVVGGLHLAGRVNEERIPETIQGLKEELGPGAVLLAGHCTGWRAKAALATAFKDGFQPCVVGGTYEFNGRTRDTGKV